MKAGGGRIKGSVFERKVAGLIVEAFSEFGICKTDCYRTPLSGGHFAASKKDPGDILMSPKLQKLFPFVIECKSYKKLQWDRMILSHQGVRGIMVKWWKQARKAALKTGGLPMVVFKQNNGLIWAMVPTLGTTQWVASPVIASYVTRRTKSHKTVQQWVTVLPFMAVVNKYTGDWRSAKAYAARRK